jgi:hypothetical protein
MKFRLANDYALLQTKLMYSTKHQVVIHLLKRYLELDRETTAQTALAKYVFNNIDAQALTILSVCTIHGKKAPIQTLIGTISSALLAKNLMAGKVIATYTCVAEFIMASPEIFKESTAFFGGRKMESMLYDIEEDEKKLFKLPSFDVPAKGSRNLGKFKWEATNKEAVKKLNNLPLVLLDFEETFMPPEGTEDRVKYDIRSALRPHLSKNNTALYFTWNMDYRGRMYASGHHFAPQGTEYEKNIFAFKNAPTELTTIQKIRVGREIKLAIAVAFGKDKVTDTKKLDWVNEHLHELDWRTAKEPTYARAQLESLRLYRATGTTNIPVELDATCSQKQIVAVLTGDLRTAMCCNIITDNKRIQDAYRLVAEEMSRITGLKFTRKQIKQSDMIDGYGAGKKKVTEQLREDLKEFYFDGAVEAFYDATNTVCPIVSTLKSTFQSLWDDTRTEWTWTLPDGYKVTYLTEQARQITVNPFGTGDIDIIAHMVVPTSRNTGLGVNIIHSVDAYVCRQMVMRCDFDVLTIHDGFRCLPQYAQTMRTTYNEIMGEIADSTLLEDIIKELVGAEITLHKQFNSSHVANSRYAIS